jgi:hypothetical protein
MADDIKRCFVISPIGDAGSPERKHADMTLNAIIGPALAESGTAFDVKRAEQGVFTWIKGKAAANGRKGQGSAPGKGLV